MFQDIKKKIKNEVSSPLGILTKEIALGLSLCPSHASGYFTSWPFLLQSCHSGNLLEKLLGIVFVCGAGATSAMATADPAPQAALWGKVKAAGPGNPSPGSCSPAMASQEGSEPSYLIHEEHQDDIFIAGALRLCFILIVG